MRECGQEFSRSVVAVVSLASECGSAVEVAAAAVQVDAEEQALPRSRRTLHPDLLPERSLSASAGCRLPGASMLNVSRWRLVAQGWRQSFPATCGPSANRRSSPLRS